MGWWRGPGTLGDGRSAGAGGGWVACVDVGVAVEGAGGVVGGGVSVAGDDAVVVCGDVMCAGGGVVGTGGCLVNGPVHGRGRRPVGEVSCSYHR